MAHWKPWIKLILGWSQGVITISEIHRKLSSTQILQHYVNHNIYFCCCIILKLCTHHSSVTAVLCTKFQNDATKEKVAVGKRVLSSNWIYPAYIFILSWLPGNQPILASLVGSLTSAINWWVKKWMWYCVGCRKQVSKKVRCTIVLDSALNLCQEPMISGTMAADLPS